ncbi:MAG: cytochrome c3 family protein [Acidobacteria bacterium]|nr:cytochrome c3 family protein [Acidobacteriota bacterium]
MKRRLTMVACATFACASLWMLSGYTTSNARTQDEPMCPPDIAWLMPDTLVMPEVVTLGKDAKLGQVTFNHMKHNGGEYQVNGAAIACITCHHAAQPASEVAKHPGMKTSFPADRTTTLTKDLFDKDPKAAGVAACRDCHARENTKPNLLDAIPKFTPVGGTELSMTNMQAFHRTCTGCHAEVKKSKPDSKGPTQIQCVMCHKKSA